MISPRLILSAFHCTVPFHCLEYPDSEDCDKPCDHSDEKRLAYLGRHLFLKSDKYNTIPIIDVKYPKNQGYNEEDVKSHDFAMLVLKKPAKYSPHIRPVCLPTQDQHFGGIRAKAAGWGRFASPDVSKSQSTGLRKVNLEVSKKKYEHTKMFGTMLHRNPIGEYKDACSGDSGA